MEKIPEKKFSLIFQLLLVFIVFVVYFLTKPPSILFQDNGRMIAAASELGISNAPGFPLYILLSHIFIAFIPFGTALVKMQLFSIMSAIALFLVVFHFLELILKNDLYLFEESIDKLEGRTRFASVFAFLASLSLAFTYQFWSQAGGTDSFILTILFITLPLFVLYKVLLIYKSFSNAKHDQKSKLLSLFERNYFIALLALAIFLGLGTGLDPIIIFILPSIIFVLWHERRFLNLKQATLLLAAGIFSTVLVYLYLPIRASTHPFVNFGNPSTWSNFWAFVRAEGLNVYLPELGEINGFTGSPVVFWQNSVHLLLELVYNFTPILIPIVLFGAFQTFKKNKSLFFFIVSILAACFIFSGLYFGGNQESWFLANYIPASIFLGIGFYYLFIILKKRLPSLAIFILLGIIALLPFIFHFKTFFEDRRNLYIATDYIDNVYSSLKPNAILISQGDFFNQTSLYEHEVGTRKDIIPITVNIFYSQKWQREILSSSTDLVIRDANIHYTGSAEYSQLMNTFFEDNITKHPIYLTPMALRPNVFANEGSYGFAIDENRFKLIPSGPVYELVPKDAKENVKPFKLSFKQADFPWKLPKFREKSFSDEISGLVGEYALSYESYGDYYLRTANKPDLAFPYYQKALSFSPKSSEIISRLGNYYAYKNDFENALKYFNKSAKIDPKNPSIYHNLALTYNSLGDFENASLNLRKVLSLTNEQTDLGKSAKALLNEVNGKIAIANFEAPKPEPGFKAYQNKKQNYTFFYPQDFDIKTDVNVVKISNNKNGGDQLTFTFFGSGKTGLGLDQIRKQANLAIPDGSVEKSENVSFNGFSASDKLYAISGNPARTLDILLTKNNRSYFIRIFPSNTNLQDLRNKILGSFNTISN